MSAGTLDDTRAPSFEVRIYRDDELVLRAFCESPEEATAVASQGSGLDHVYLLVDDGSPTQGPGDVFDARRDVRARRRGPAPGRHGAPGIRNRVAGTRDEHRSHGGDGPRTGGAGQGRPRR